MKSRMYRPRFRKKLPALIFIITGIISTAWFLIRVIPKPSRATYPCMRAAAPVMSSFVIWLLALVSSSLLLGKTIRFIRREKYLLGTVMLLSAFLAAALLTGISPGKASASAMHALPGDFSPNQPMGEARGIFPGRVVWYWDPEATNELSDNTVNNDGIIDNEDDVYYLAKNNNEAVIDNMLEQVMLYLTDAGTLSNAWDSVFRYHNRMVGQKAEGYAAGEVIYIKTNNQGIGITNTMNPDLSQDDGKVWNSFPPHMTATSPFAIRAVVKQLVDVAGIPESKIYVGDPHNNFNDIYYEILRNGYPDIHIIGINANDVNDCEAHGRTLSVKGTENVVHYSDESVITAGPDRLYQQLLDADYIINIAAMKSHIRGGITLFCKSHFGSHTRSSASHLHPGLPSPDGQSGNTGYGKYRVLTDIMGHRDLGGKTMLHILDALWGGPPHELDEPRKWDMSPFDGDWTSSLFASLDPVAIASVGFDFLRTEYSTAVWGDEAYPNMPGVDDYLHQAADEANWPDGVVYDPENDGTPISSLGVHEHWNNPADKQYSRELGTGEGIELIKAHSRPYHTPAFKAGGTAFQCHPNPATGSTMISLSNAYRGKVIIRVYSQSGQLVTKVDTEKESDAFRHRLGLSEFPAGNYFLKVDFGRASCTGKLILQ